MPSTFFLINLCFYYYYYCCLLSKCLLIFLRTFPMLSMKVFYLHHFILLHYHCNLRKEVTHSRSNRFLAFATRRDSTGDFNFSFPCGSNPKPLNDITDMSILSSEAGQYWFTTGLSKWHPTPIFLPGEFHGQRTWQAAVHGVKKSRTRLSDFHFTCYQFTSS